MFDWHLVLLCRKHEYKSKYRQRIKIIKKKIEIEKY